MAIAIPIPYVSCQSPNSENSASRTQSTVRVGSEDPALRLHIGSHSTANSASWGVAQRESSAFPFFRTDRRLSRLEFRSQSTANSAVQSKADVESIGFPWLPEALALGPDNYTIEQLSQVVGDIDSKLNQHQYELLGAATELLPCDQLSPHLLVTVLRVMSPARFSIPRWTTLAKRVGASLAARGIDADKKLRGMI